MRTHTVHPEITALQRTPAPVRRVSAQKESNRVHKRGLYLGTDPDGNQHDMTKLILKL